MDCPSYDQLVLHTLGEVQNTELQLHRTSCSTCDTRVALLERMLAGLAQGDLPPVPGRLTRSAEALGAPLPRERAAEPAASPIERFVSKLRIVVAELLPGPDLVPVVRRSSASEHRRLYAADDFEIDVLVTRDRQLIGQLMPLADEDAGLDSASCTLIGDETLHTSLTPTGEFQFQRVGRGPASLTFEWGDVRVLLPEVELPD